MPQTHDVLIDGAGYMLVPGTYMYKSTGAAVTPVRTGVPSFEQRLAVSNLAPVVVDRDATRWRAVGMMPVPVGLGDEDGRLILAPRELTGTVATAANFDAQSIGIVYKNRLFFTVGARLYESTIVGGNFSTGVTLVGTAAGVITAMAVVGGLLYLALAAPAATMANYAGSGGLVAAPAVTASYVFGYAFGIWRAKLSDASILSGSIDGGATWTDFPLDSAIRSAATWRGRATGGGVQIIGTQYMLWELAGQWVGSPAAFTGTVSPVFDGRFGGGDDDFVFMADYRGAIYTWYAGSVHRWDGTHLTPVAGGPRGLHCWSIVTAGGYLCVSFQDGGTLNIWCYDGVRWFGLGQSLLALNLFGTAGAITDGHLMAFDFTTQTISRWEFPVRGLTTNPATTGRVIVGPLDAGEGDAVKTWQEIRVAWSTATTATGAAPAANPGGNLLVEYSVDDGANYVSLGATVIAVGARSGLVQVAMSGIEAQRLLVRITWTPTSMYAAFQIDSVHASGWRIGDTPKEERWTFTVKCTDKLIRRDGSVDTRTGEQQLQALRALAQAGRTFVFHDIDDDLAARAITARVIDLTETERKGDGVHFLESKVKLILSAVS